ncbi:LuxR family transcriptional regulator [Streptomyces sp. DH37]|uniref:LuxR C-terminal-related transcriptional regulator n=1 Tax=Streptomyces sp. DH37 TaxID=3040122 RepID=UPI0024416A11|nr:LuxR family transcriptional regulator [Streptomyces sp. DH37]MDG9700706.1 LuxR C-terminal-related transcriptional regulator [Streptomyces sp. DH37]
MPTGPLRERREALELVAAEAGRARSGAGRLVLFRGATGTGRTTLLEAAVEQEARHRMRVLRVRCSAEEPPVPLSAVLHLLDPAADGDVPGGPADAVDAAGLRERSARLWRSFRSRAAEGPLLAAVDDVHLADPHSRRWLTDAARRLDGLPVLLLVTERNQYDVDPPSPGVAHSLPPALVRVHTLRPLSRTAAEALVRAHGGAGAPRAWVEGCLRAGAGNPLLLRALLDDLRAMGGDGAPAELPGSCAELYPGGYAAAVGWWLENCGPETAAVARTLAVLEDFDGDDGGDGGGPGGDGRGDGEGFTELLAEAAGADPARVRGWTTAAVRLGLLDRDPVRGRPRFAHPLLREAVAGGWSRTRRQEVHRTAAELLHRRGERAERVARHLLRSRAFGTAWAADVLLDAASVAVRGDRRGDAVRYLRRALEEPMPRARRTAVLTELGSLEFATARSSAGIPRLAEALRRPGTPQDKVRAAVALGTALARRGEAHTALAVLRDLDVRPSDHPALARAVRTASALLSDHDRQVRQEFYARLRETAGRSPALVGPAECALLVRYEATAGLLSAEEAMERIRALLEEPEEPEVEPYLLGTAATVAQWADELDEADRLVRRGLAVQHPSLLHPMRPALLNVRADVAAARGRYGALLADPAVRAAPEDGGVRPDPGNAEAHAVIALVETGRFGEARRLAGSFSVRDSHDSWELNRFLYARGVLRAACGDPAGALEDFLECGRRQTSRDVVSPVVTPWRSAAAECHLALGRPREALRTAEEEHRLATVWGTPRLTGRALRVMGAATGGRRGLELAERAVRVLRDATAEVDTELVPALVSQGRCLAAAGQRGRARETLREAASLAERLGAVRMRALAEDALRGTGARRAHVRLTGSAALTDGERRVARLAAGGHTNAEIARLLHLARRTVETHLTSAYRKLGIRRRAELATALDEREPGGGTATGRASGRPGGDDEWPL